MDRPELAFYCVADRDHFLGLAALVNSLRVLGHDDPVHVLDCGFAGWQRAVLEAGDGGFVVDADPTTPAKLQKTLLPFTPSASVKVVVDVDVIFTRRLDELVGTARSSGRPVLFPNDVTDRF